MATGRPRATNDKQEHPRSAAPGLGIQALGMRAMLLPGRLQATSGALACDERQAAWLDQRECRVRRGPNDTTLPPETRPAHPPVSSVGTGRVANALTAGQ